MGPLTFIYFISFKKCFLLCVFGCQFRFTALFFLVPLQFEQQYSHSPHAVQCCSQDCLVKPGVYSQTMSIMPGPVDPLQRRFEAFFTFREIPDTEPDKYKRCVAEYITGQSKQAGWDFICSWSVRICVCLCVLGKGREPTKGRGNESMHRTESRRALCICWDHSFFAY